MTTQNMEHAIGNARGHLETIRAMVAAYHNDGGEIDGDKYETADAVLARIYEYPLSLEVKTDWHYLNSDDTKPTDYRILLTTGGPALQIIGELNEHGSPETAILQYKDWFTPWTNYELDDDDIGILVKFAGMFCWETC